MILYYTYSLKLKKRIPEHKLNLKNMSTLKGV